MRTSPGATGAVALQPIDSLGEVLGSLSALAPGAPNAAAAWDLVFELRPQPDRRAAHISRPISRPSSRPSSSAGPFGRQDGARRGGAHATLPLSAFDIATGRAAVAAASRPPPVTTAAPWSPAGRPLTAADGAATLPLPMAHDGWPGGERVAAGGGGRLEPDALQLDAEAAAELALGSPQALTVRVERVARRPLSSASSLEPGIFARARHGGEGLGSVVPPDMPPLDPAAAAAAAAAPAPAPAPASVLLARG